MPAKFQAQPYKIYSPHHYFIATVIKNGRFIYSTEEIKTTTASVKEQPDE